MKARYFALIIFLVAGRMAWVSGMGGLVFAAKLLSPLLIVVGLAGITKTRLFKLDRRSQHDSHWWDDPQYFWLKGNVFHKKD